MSSQSASQSNLSELLRSAFIEGLNAGWSDNENSMRPIAGGLGMQGPSSEDTLWEESVIRRRSDPTLSRESSRSLQEVVSLIQLSKMTAALDQLSDAAEAWAARGGAEAHCILPLIHPSFNAVYQAYKPLRSAQPTTGQEFGATEKAAYHAIEEALRIYDRLRVAYAGTDVMAQAIVEPLLKVRPDFELSYSGANGMVERTPLPPLSAVMAAVEERNRIDPEHDARVVDYAGMGAREPAYQYREIGEGDGWRDCSKATYDGFRSDPHIDTREVPAASQSLPKPTHPAPVGSLSLRGVGVREALREDLLSAAGRLWAYDADGELPTPAREKNPPDSLRDVAVRAVRMLEEIRAEDTAQGRPWWKHTLARFVLDDLVFTLTNTEDDTTPGDAAPRESTGSKILRSMGQAVSHAAGDESTTRIRLISVETRTLHVVFDGPPGPEGGRFVEVETPDGRSVDVGEWHGPRADGLYELRIPCALTSHPTTEGETAI